MHIHLFTHIHMHLLAYTLCTYKRTHTGSICYQGYRFHHSGAFAVLRLPRSMLVLFSHVKLVVQVGNLSVKRRSYQPFSQSPACILHKQLAGLESLATCMDMGWMAILVSHPSCHIFPYNMPPE